MDNKKEKQMFKLLVDAILSNKYRAKTMLSYDLDLATYNFYNGQVIVLQRILESIEEYDLNRH